MSPLQLLSIKKWQWILACVAYSIYTNGLRGHTDLCPKPLYIALVSSHLHGYTKFISQRGKTAPGTHSDLQGTHNTLLTTWPSELCTAINIPSSWTVYAAPRFSSDPVQQHSVSHVCVCTSQLVQEHMVNSLCLRPTDPVHTHSLTCATASTDHYSLCTSLMST